MDYLQLRLKGTAVFMVLDGLLITFSSAAILYMDIIQSFVIFSLHIIKKNPYSTLVNPITVQFSFTAVALFLTM